MRIMKSKKIENKKFFKQASYFSKTRKYEENNI